MSLTYHSEHLAWQQRVNQEKTRSNDFNKTFSNFSTFDEALQTGRNIFPKANQLEKPINYSTHRYSLGYSFGGTKHIKHALKDSDQITHHASLSPSKQPSGDYFKRSTAKTASSSPRKNIQASPLKSLKQINPALARLDDELRELKLSASRTSFDDGGEIYMRELEKKLAKERKKRIKLELAVQKAKTRREI